MRRKVFYILTLAVVLASVAALFGVWRTPDELTSAISTKPTGASPCTLSPQPRQFNRQPYYTGPMIDAHMHMPTPSRIVSLVSKQLGLETPSLSRELSIDYIACLLENENTKQAFGFYIFTRYADGQTARMAADFEKKYPGQIVPFFMPAPVNLLNLPPQAVESIFNKRKGLFKGLGEIKSEFETARDLENPNLLALYKLAQNNNLVVMIHPRRDQQTAVEKVLAQYPNVSFLLHGGDADDWITELMAKHKNVYYSLDANLTSLYGWEKQHQLNQPGREEFLEYFRSNFDNVVDRALGNWKNKIEAYPNRFLWGTDRWYGWHFNKDVSGLLEEFGRTFIGQLPPAMQENFAYKNAERLVKNNTAASATPSANRIEFKAGDLK